MNKYRNKKTVSADGTAFDSKKEAKRWDDLKLLEMGGIIQDLERQCKYRLLPSQDGERPVYYVADFRYKENDKTVIEDTKSPISKTPTYILKRKLMLFFHGIKIKET